MAVALTADGDRARLGFVGPYAATLGLETTCGDNGTQCRHSLSSRSSPDVIGLFSNFSNNVRHELN
jgi:hypothetical protein